jgi:hypothetical protein
MDSDHASLFFRFPINSEMENGYEAQSRQRKARGWLDNDLNRAWLEKLASTHRFDTWWWLQAIRPHARGESKEWLESKFAAWFSPGVGRGMIQQLFAGVESPYPGCALNDFIAASLRNTCAWSHGLLDLAEIVERNMGAYHLSPTLLLLCSASHYAKSQHRLITDMAPHRNRNEILTLLAQAAEWSPRRRMVAGNY